MQTHKFKWKLFDIEYSSVKIWELEGEMRIDSEYYDKYYLDIQNKVIRKNYDYLKNLASNKYQNYKPNWEFFEYIEISWVNTQTWTFQSETLETKNQPLRAKKTVNKNDILISTVRPNRGGVTFINDEKTNIVASTWFCKLSTNKLNPKYLYILFRTNIYRDLLVRNTTATMYPAVSEDDILNFTIPIPSKSFQKKIESLVIESYKQNELAEKLYKEAETLLLTELNLLNYQTKTKKIKFDWNYEIDAKENHSITNYSILKELDRFDAEYWDYSYFEIVEKIKNYRWWFDKLSNLIKISKKKIILDEEKLYNYIELADINK